MPSDVIATCYVRHVFQKEARKVVVEEVCRLLSQPEFEEVDSIAASGVSGNILASIVADRMGKNLIIVRKGEASHASYDVEGMPYNKSPKYIIIDDFVASGSTLDRIINKITQVNRNSSLIGFIFYMWDIQPKTDNEYKLTEYLKGIQKIEDTKFDEWKPEYRQYRGAKYIAAFSLVEDGDQYKVR